MKTNKIDKNIIKASLKATINYPYNLVATIKEVFDRANAKVIFTIDEVEYSYRAITTQPLHQEDKSNECLLSFNRGKLSQPIIIGIIQSDDNRPLILSCDDGVILECGDTTIELDGSTLNLQAPHINSQAYGPHRIKGASVKIN